MEQVTMKRSNVTMEKKIPNDLISPLPDHILHQIMSLLPQRYAVATSVLSHRWEKLWLSFPSIVLNETDFNNRESFYFCLGATLARHKLSELQNLSLRMEFPGSLELYEHVCVFVNRVLLESKTLKELEVQFLDDLYFRRKENVPSLENICVLPMEIFSISSYLVFLRVESSRFEGCPHVNLPSLKTLFMRNVFINDEFLLELIHGCPVLDMLSVKYCFGIKNVMIRLPTLKTLVLGLRNDLESLELNVPFVKSIKLYALFDSMTGGLVHVLGYKNSDKILTKNLETFCLKGLSIRPEVLHNTISIFPNLEKLGLKDCDILGRAQLYTNKLATLEMTYCLLQEEVDISAPNLQNIEYVHDPNGAELNYMAFRHLRRIFLVGIEVNGILWINNSNWPSLVSLKLVSCMNMKGLRICLDKLESLNVCGCQELQSCWIVAPQLLTFSYTGQVVHISRLIVARNLDVKLHLKEPKNNHEHVWLEFAKMFVDFLRELDVSAARMTIKLTYECHICWLMIKDVHVPPTSFVQHLEVETNVISLQDLLYCSLSISQYCNVLSINYVGLSSLTLQFQESKYRESCRQKTNFGLLEDLLVRVEVRDLKGMDDEVNLIAYLVEKATKMQQMKIWIEKGNEYAKQMFLQACFRINSLSRLLQHFDISDGSCILFSRNARYDIETYFAYKPSC